jgi:hypothetical protein
MEEEASGDVYRGMLIVLFHLTRLLEKKSKLGRAL